MNPQILSLYKGFNSKLFSIIGIGQELLPNKQEIKELRIKISAFRQQDETALVNVIGPILYNNQDKIRSNNLLQLIKSINRDEAIKQAQEGCSKAVADMIERYGRVILNTILDTIDTIDSAELDEISKTVNDMLVEYCKITVYNNTGKVV